MKAAKRLAAGTAALVAAVFVFALLARPPARLALAPAAGGLPSVRGAWHVHTTRSDGSGTPDAVAAAAARAGLQFIAFADHDRANRPPDPPAYRSGVLCLDGVEISTSAGHYAALGLEAAAPYPLAGEARDVIEDVRRLGGFGVLAHPDSGKAALRWQDWSAWTARPPDALEWLNADSEWRDESATGLARALSGYLFRKPEAIVSVFSRPAETLARWDDFTRHAPVVGLAAHDAHARFGLRGEADPADSPDRVFLGLPSYEAMFRAFSLGVTLDRAFTGDAAADGRALLQALRAGHVHSVIDAMAGPASLEFRGEGGGVRAIEGGLLPAGPAVLTVRATAAPGAVIRLVRAGQVVAEERGPALRHETGGAPGAYRPEIHLPRAPGRPPVPWIVGNPIYVGPFTPLPPAPALPQPSVSTPLDPAPAAWRVEHDAESRVLVEAGEDAIPGIRFRYSLGRTAPNVYAAVVHRIGGLPAFDRVSFDARADRPMRVSVQVRDPRGEGERWVRSAYLDTTAREQTLRLDDFRPSVHGGRPRPEVGQLDSLLFVVDTVNTLPGSEGTVWLSGVRLERK